MEPASVVARKKVTQVERAARARALLIDVAVQQIRDKGLAYVTLSEIADQAGMTRGAIHHHFGGRDDYIRAVLNALTDRVETLLDAPPPNDHAPRDVSIRRAVETLGRIVLSRDQLAVTDISISSRSVVTSLSESMDVSERMVQIYSDAWARWLGALCDADALRKSFEIFRIFCSGVLAINYGRLDAADLDEKLTQCGDLVVLALNADDSAPGRRPRRQASKS